MIFNCNTFYVGKTIREFRQQIGDHLYYSTNGKLTTIGHHIGLHHKFDPHVVKLLVLEVVPQSLRGGDWDMAILQLETVWIERLNATIPPGLNEMLSAQLCAVTLSIITALEIPILYNGYVAFLCYNDSIVNHVFSITLQCLHFLQ